MLNYFPKYFTSKAIYLYLGVLTVVSFAFFSRALPFVWIAFGFVEVLTFFYFSNKLTLSWAKFTEKKFVVKLFWLAFIIRVVYVLFSYYFYESRNGIPFELGAADSLMYDDVSQSGASWIRNGNYDVFNGFTDLDMSDRGYPTYLSYIYSISDNSVLLARIFKAFWSSFMCVLVYKLASRTFNESTGRIAALLTTFMPNLIYYTGIHLKETEMTFLVIAFLERADYVIRNKNYNFINIALPVILAGFLFLFRTVVGVTALFSFFTVLIFSTNKVMGMGKRTLLIIWGIVALSYFVGGKISAEIEQVWENRNDNQKSSMEYRSGIEGGNKFAKYASSTVFAPMIFVIPFPTIVHVPIQENQMMIHGGNFVKNIMAFFVIFALILIIKSGKWRDYTLIGSFMMGYLIVIALSKFAASERFHVPAIPLLMIFAAYGISQVTNKTKKYFSWWMIFIFVAIVGWSWFKLAGRGAV